ncbi:MAG: hypothetical protein AAF763_09635 [Pseudomonadota bacterium]
MALDALRSFETGLTQGVEAARAAAREAELALSRRVMPGEDWAQAGAPDLAFDAAREAFREAHARAVLLAEEAGADEAGADEAGTEKAEADDPDAWPDEPFED